MRRGLLAALLILHGLSHANVGVWAYGAGPTWLVTGLWAVSMLGFFAALQQRITGPAMKQALIDHPGEGFDMCAAQIVLQRGSLVNRRGLGKREEQDVSEGGIA